MTSFPRPIQKELNVWLTCSGGEQRFIDAGKHGYNVLTALLFQTAEQLCDKIKQYRRAREDSGFDPASGKVTLMLHTFLSDDQQQAYAIIKAPFMQYLKTSAHLWSQQVKDWDTLSSKQQQKLLEYGFQRYSTQAALFGDPSTARQMIKTLDEAGVDEVACLIDFGVAPSIVLEHIPYIDALI